MRRPRNAMPVKVFKEMGLGIIKRGKCKVVAGVLRGWWQPFGPEPVVVKARILRRKERPRKGATTASQ